MEIRTDCPMIYFPVRDSRDILPRLGFVFRLRMCQDTTQSAEKDEV